ncbi:MAG: hypothetical protein RLZZ262_908 [Bacteroidota bacterium]
MEPARESLLSDLWVKGVADSIAHDELQTNQWDMSSERRLDLSSLKDFVPVEDSIAHDELQTNRWGMSSERRLDLSTLKD